MGSRLIDLTGQRFGRYLVTGRAPTSTTPSGQRRTRWFCVCDCGNEREVDGQNLREGKAESCGCLAADNARARFRDLRGQRFGRLVAIERAATLHDQSTTWLCECLCGTRKVVRTTLLVKGMAKSCGCYSREASAARRWRGDDISYFGMHDRVRIARGTARERPCVDCGGPARDWSYDGLDLNAKQERVNGSLLWFSTDINHYQARCSKCHRRYDVSRRTA